MNRIVREHYPAAQLPEDLRPGGDSSVRVTVTIEAEESQPDQFVSLDEIWALRQAPFRSKQQIDSDLRELREEWDD